MKLFYTLLLVLTTSTAAIADNAETICKEKWQDNYRKLEYCIKEQIQAKKDLDEWFYDTDEFEILDKCIKEWTAKNFAVNYRKALHCVKQQYKAKERPRQKALLH